MSKGGLMIVAGGTGGHVFPALAVAKELQGKGVVVRWMGTKRGLESRVVPAADIPIDWITIEGLRGKGRLSLFLAPFKLVRAMWQAGRLIVRHKPDLVLGMGGFVAGPGGITARLLGRPLVIHEQNAVAGLTNCYLAKVASSVLTGFPDVEGLPKSSVWVGNPVRESIGTTNSTASSSSNSNNASELRVLVIGGSQGAHSFNTLLPSLFAKLATQLNSDKRISLDVWHQSGRKRDIQVKEAYAANSADTSSKDFSFKVSEFIEDMAQALHWADVVVCRAGAMTIAELCAAAKPSVPVPYPFSAGDHQDKNADFLVKAGAARLLSNKQLDSDQLLNVFMELTQAPETFKQMANNAHKLHKPNALQDVVAVCEEYIHA